MTKTPYQEGKDAYWDFECGYDDVQLQNHYVYYSDSWLEWNRGFIDARNLDNL